MEGRLILNKEAINALWNFRTRKKRMVRSKNYQGLIQDLKASSARLSLSTQTFLLMNLPDLQWQPPPCRLQQSGGSLFLHLLPLPMTFLLPSGCSQIFCSCPPTSPSNILFFSRPSSVLICSGRVSWPHTFVLPHRHPWSGCTIHDSLAPPIICLVRKSTHFLCWPFF